MARLIARHAPLIGCLKAPASKPDTQRALICAALADGTSVIREPLISGETLVMIEACRALGAEVEHESNAITVRGMGSASRSGARPETRYVWAAGSALVGRLAMTIGSALPERVIVDGNCNLRGRPFAPLFTALRNKGAACEFFDGEDRLPCVAVSQHLPGGSYQLATSVSSQFVTALLVPAPLAVARTTIALTGPHYSMSYIRQTIEMMRRFGVPVTISDDERSIAVPHGVGYGARDVGIFGDYTSASYILGAAFVTRGHIVVTNLDTASLQGERAIVDIVEALGAKITWRPDEKELEVDCTRLPARVEAEFDLHDCPNILPTVAAIAATVRGRVRITGARLTQFHKSRRIEAMATELAKAGVPVTILHGGDGSVDGLEIRGEASHAGHVVFSGHGDHRIFMALALFAMSCEQPCVFGDSDSTFNSFPEFLSLLGLNQQPTRKVNDERQRVARAG